MITGNFFKYKECCIYLIGIIIFINLSFILAFINLLQKIQIIYRIEKSKNKIMIDQFIERLKHDKANWTKFKNFFQEKEITAKTTLLKEGEIAQNLYFIKTGCLRLWFNNDGKDITFQFFFEHQAVSSIESFMNKQPSMFTLESIEPTSFISIKKEDFDTLNNHYPRMKEEFYNIILQRMENYARLFLSRIKDNPQKRYQDLVKDHPEIIKRIPQHYIASYLGITPISLSRIRNKK